MKYGIFNNKIIKNNMEVKIILLRVFCMFLNLVYQLEWFGKVIKMKYNC